MISISVFQKALRASLQFDAQNNRSLSSKYIYIYVYEMCGFVSCRGNNISTMFSGSWSVCLTRFWLNADEIICKTMKIVPEYSENSSLCLKLENIRRIKKLENNKRTFLLKELCAVIVSFRAFPYHENQSRFCKSFVSKNFTCFERVIQIVLFPVFFERKRNFAHSLYSIEKQNTSHFWLVCSFSIEHKEIVKL